jgi:hypothetical protein
MDFPSEEWDEDEELVMLMMETRSNKKPKHGRSAVGR